MVATVNGVEITVAELNGEAQARGLDIDSDRALRDALVRELVERKLLVEQARAQKVDQTPHFLLADRRQREILLAQQLLTAPDEVAALSPAQLQSFIAARPLAFDGRVLAEADQLAVAGSIPPALQAQLAAAPTLDAAAGLLARARLAGTRTRESWDSADPSTPVGSGEVRPTVGTRYLLARPGGTIVGVVTAVRPTPVPADQRLATARALVGRDIAERRMRALLARSAASAEIAYNPAFAPTAGER